MLTRPLDLMSRLKPAPRSFDLWHVVNAGLIALFFSVFGSRFVLSPGIRVDLPTVNTAAAGFAPSTFRVYMPRAGVVITDDSPMNYAAFVAWLPRRIEGVHAPVMLLQADRAVPTEDVLKIVAMAREARVAVQWAVRIDSASGTTR